MLLECKSVVKQFGALLAVNRVSFAVQEGETLGIMGPNGAGKSTLMNLIMGVFPLSSGEIKFAGETISGLSTSQISRRGIGRTYQIPQPFPTMTVLENLMVGQLYGRRVRTMRTARHNAMGVLERVGLAAKAQVPASQLGLLDLKRLELARALSLEPRLLLLDEIFGGLVDREVEELQKLIAEFKAQGLTMLIIEHVLKVLFNHSDRIIVLDFGEKIAEGTPAAIAQDEKVIEVYLGEANGALTVKAAPPAAATREPLLRVSHLSAGYGSFQALFDVSLEIFEQEIVALMGINGAGKTTLIRAITRQIPLLAGDVVYQGQSIRHSKVHDLGELGIAQVIEGRKIFPLMTVQENLEMGAYPPRARAQRQQTLEQVFALFPRLRERARQLGRTLSGGEQQMLAIGRALMALPRLLILDEISLGLAPLIIDDLYRTIREINEQGTTILLVEQNMHRSLEVADRAYILEHGRIILSGTASEISSNPDVQQAYFGFEK